MSKLKTGAVFSYDFTVNLLVKNIIDSTLTDASKHLVENQTTHKVFSESQYGKLVKSLLQINNRELRKAYENVGQKIFKLRKADMAHIMGHTPESAESSYLNAKKYTAAESKSALARIKNQLAQNASPMP